MVRHLHIARKSLGRRMLLWPYMLTQDLLIHRGIRGAHAVINQTAYQRRRLKFNFGKDGVILPSFFPPPPSAANPCKEKEVLWLANLSPGKQPEAFIRLARLCRGFTDWKFILVGGTPNQTYWETICKQSANVPNLELVGPVAFEDTGSYFARASLFVNTSQPSADGLPNAFIQAWLHATPVLSLQHDPNGWIQSNGLGFWASGNLSNLEEAIRSCLQQPDRIRAAGEICRRFAQETFASEQIIDAYLEIFEPAGLRRVEA
jgi:glycosyltransferase involved in cell wall biosynthesis